MSYSFFSSTYPTPGVSQSDPVPMQDAIHSVASFLPQLHHTPAEVNIEQDKQQLRHNKTAIAEIEQDITTIGSVLSNGKFLCAAKGCERLTFGRQADFRRHHTSLHAAIKPNFWCQVPTCRRSMIRGGTAFSRKDKLAAHVREWHPVLESGDEGWKAEHSLDLLEQPVSSADPGESGCANARLAESISV